MSGKYDALIAEAEVRIMQSETRTHAVMADTELIDRLAAALREAQAHVPPEGWRVTEYTREDSSQIAAHGSRKELAKNGLTWRSYDAHGDYIDRFPTAAAAMAAIEGHGK